MAYQYDTRQGTGVHPFIVARKTLLHNLRIYVIVTRELMHSTSPAKTKPK